MKNLIVALFLSCFFCTDTLVAQTTPGSRDTVETIQGFRSLYRYQNFYIGGQPTYEVLQWLKNKDVNTIINLRTVKENQDFAAASFTEEAVALQMGFIYHSLPVDGLKDHTPAKLDEMAGFLAGDKPVYIHCASAGRATQFFMAFLVKYRNYEIDKAIEVGKQLTFSFPLENLLDTKITMKALTQSDVTR
jgi:protein tyrosine phosphatase (PTP) superfamily phosphohydrolase (DUF442 family)